MFLLTRSIKFRYTLGLPTRSLSTSKAHTQSRLGLRLASGALLGTSLLAAGSIYADADTPANPERMPLPTLLRTYLVYSICSAPFIVDRAPAILDALLAVPGVRSLTEAFVRATFFAQFVGGETAHETLPLLHRLRAQNKGVLFAYSVEVPESSASSSTAPSVQVEVEGERPVHKRIVDEMIRSIDVAADFEDSLGKDTKTGRRTWVAVKMTALLPSADTLAHLSAYLVRTRPAPHTPVPFPGTPLSSDLDVLAPVSNPAPELSQADLVALRELRDDLVRICRRAEERGVRIIVDAEYSWYQPAIDALTYALMRQFNTPPSTPYRLLDFFSLSSSPSPRAQPLVYATYQAYLRRAPEHLAASLADAERHGYSLGVKLVRGAYHPHEIAAHRSASHLSPSSSASPTPTYSPSLSPDSDPPVWSTKAETDACFDTCAALLVSRLAAATKGKGGSGLGVLFGTHNWASCALLLRELMSAGLAREEDGVVRLEEGVAERVAVGQLFGMSDELTDYMVRRTRSEAPFVIKYVPYGALSEVMPYLSRRAIENKSVLGEGGAREERRRAGKEIRRKIFGEWIG